MLSLTELEEVLRYWRLSTEGDESALAWRLVRQNPKYRGMNVSWNSMVDEALDISSVRAGPSWVGDTTSAPNATWYLTREDSLSIKSKLSCRSNFRMVKRKRE